jgi:hypothetical protein
MSDADCGSSIAITFALEAFRFAARRASSPRAGPCLADSASHQQTHARHPPRTAAGEAASCHSWTLGGPAGHCMAMFLPCVREADGDRPTSLAMRSLSSTRPTTSSKRPTSTKKPSSRPSRSMRARARLPSAPRATYTHTDHTGKMRAQSRWESTETRVWGFADARSGRFRAVCLCRTRTTR